MKIKHKMKLYKEPFRQIQSGKKTVEVRLYDQKRRRLKRGDTIEFTKLPGEDEKLTVKVTKLCTYPTFREMFEDIPAEKFGTVDNNIEKWVESIHTLYSPAREQEWGSLAIEIELLVP
ncbi:ASCH domain-containing protein [Planococcus sp. CP5-4]|uniref:ASCH domain-containing protein n=1 Tax=unclassified Planococcus (in: firmicutes) TaxID=2662419 RepID=UPI001C230994|nr:MULTISPECIES: ASCH domain-containing protein [unclassified Planococcus (in: firmicutes)]MBU9674502.1 ASCH domain-containing protein [Planococcus sp. CP5-4_YE]MBV0910133.1 ASCH domain-containing protein [Planococcus sp. CP5-4_UN]MBW6064660.1 ASCH domain-containing protein [Planococcus sp. CP5-4]